MGVRKNIKEQLIATTKSAKQETEQRLNKLSLNERINRAERVVSRGKVVRDAFTLQEQDIALLQEILSNCMSIGVQANKSLIVRAGIRLMAKMPKNQLKEVIADIPKVKIGRSKIL